MTLNSTCRKQPCWTESRDLCMIDKYSMKPGYFLSLFFFSTICLFWKTISTHQKNHEGNICSTSTSKTHRLWLNYLNIEWLSTNRYTPIYYNIIVTRVQRIYLCKCYFSTKQNHLRETYFPGNLWLKLSQLIIEEENRTCFLDCPKISLALLNCLRRIRQILS